MAAPTRFLPPGAYQTRTDALASVQVQMHVHVHVQVHVQVHVRVHGHEHVHVHVRIDEIDAVALTRVVCNWAAC